jgi:hypothetical protein
MGALSLDGDPTTDPSKIAASRATGGAGSHRGVAGSGDVVRIDAEPDGVGLEQNMRRGQKPSHLAALAILSGRPDSEAFAFCGYTGRLVMTTLVPAVVVSI